MAILDEAGQEVPLGEIGEIGVRGPQVMRGYWNAPQETAKAFTPDGWFRTGDMGRMDARGYVEFTDRSKDVIVVSGMKAWPTEIEDVVMRHPGVKDAGAVGMPDARTGEAIALFVVRRDPGSPPRRCASTAPSTSPATSGRSGSSSATSCPRRRSARCCAASSRKRPPASPSEGWTPTGGPRRVLGDAPVGDPPALALDQMAPAPAGVEYPRTRQTRGAPCCDWRTVLPCAT